jgi:hypothetical protein
MAETLGIEDCYVDPSGCLFVLAAKDASNDRIATVVASHPTLHINGGTLALTSAQYLEPGIVTGNKLYSHAWVIPLASRPTGGETITADWAAGILVSGSDTLGGATAQGVYNWLGDDNLPTIADIPSDSNDILPVGVGHSDNKYDWSGHWPCTNLMRTASKWLYYSGSWTPYDNTDLNSDTGLPSVVLGTHAAVKLTIDFYDDMLPNRAPHVPLHYTWDGDWEPYFVNFIDVTDVGDDTHGGRHHRALIPSQKNGYVGFSAAVGGDAPTLVALALDSQYDSDTGLPIQEIASYTKERVANVKLHRFMDPIWTNSSNIASEDHITPGSYQRMNGPDHVDSDIVIGASSDLGGIDFHYSEYPRSFDNAVKLDIWATELGFYDGQSGVIRQSMYLIGGVDPSDKPAAPLFDSSNPSILEVSLIIMTHLTGAIMAVPGAIQGPDRVVEVSVNRGCAPERIADMVNATDCTICWVNIPHASTAGYTTEYFSRLHTAIDPAKQSSVTYPLELSNEIWNDGFNQYFYFHHGYNWHETANKYQMYVKLADQHRTAAAAGLMDADPGLSEAQALAKIKLTLSGQAGAISQLQGVLDAAVALGVDFDYAAIAPYMYLANRKNLAPSAANRDLVASLSPSGVVSLAALDEIRIWEDWITPHIDAVNAYNIAQIKSVKLMQYEGGLHWDWAYTINSAWHWANQTDLGNRLAQATRHPRILGIQLRQWLRCYDEAKNGTGICGGVMQFVLAGKLSSVCAPEKVNLWNAYETIFQGHGIRNTDAEVEASTQAKSTRADGISSLDSPRGELIWQWAGNQAASGTPEIEVKGAPDEAGWAPWLVLPQEKYPGAPPNLFNGTAFGSAEQGAAARSATFYVRNRGTSNLTVAIAALDAAFTLVTTGLGSPIAPGDTGTFTITLETATAGDKSDDVVLTINDPTFATGEFTFPISGSITEAETTAPQASVIYAFINTIPSGYTEINATHGTLFEAAVVNEQTPIVTYLLYNFGDGVLNITSIEVSGSDFTVTEGLGATLNPSTSDLFTIAMSTATAGLKTGTVTITTDDPTNPEYTFDIAGVVMSPEAATVFCRRRGWLRGKDSHAGLARL